MKLLSEKKALDRLKQLISDFRSQISDRYEHRAKNCLTCEVQGSCCLDAHFVNVHISRLEAVSMRRTIDRLPGLERDEIYGRVAKAIVDYDLKADGETYAQTFACPLFEKGKGCLVHESGKPVSCIMHACYEKSDHLPPGDLLIEKERSIDRLNARVYGRPEQWLPLPVAIQRLARASQSAAEDSHRNEEK